MSSKREQVTTKFKGNTLSVMSAQLLTHSKRIELEFVSRSEVSLVIPVLDDGRIVFVKQYRVSLDREILEFPGGKVENGEDPIEAAQRELEEETGYIASDLKKLSTFYIAPHFTNEMIRVYLAKGLKKGIKSLEQEERMRSEIYSSDQIGQLLENRIIDAKTIIGINSLITYLNYEG